MYGLQKLKYLLPGFYIKSLQTHDLAIFKMLFQSMLKLKFQYFGHLM